MAKQVENIVVRLGLERFEGLDKIKSSFRDLGKVTKLTESDILDARKAVFDFAKEAGNTEAVVDGLKSALTGLRSQADLCGTAYSQLTQDLRKLNEVQLGATQATYAQRNALVRSFDETTRNVRVLREHRDALLAVQAQTRDYSRAYDILAEDIGKVTERIEDVTRVTKTYNQVLTRVVPGTAAGARRRNQQLEEGIQLQRDVIDGIDLLSEKERKATVVTKERAAAVEKLNRGLAQRRIITFQESARAGRESVIAGATAFADKELTVGYLSADKIGRRLGELPDTTAGLNQELAELNERLINTVRSSENYLTVARLVADAQRELAAVTQGYAQSLVIDLNTGVLTRSSKNLREVIAALRAEMDQLDTTTSEGSAAYAQNANQVRILEKELRDLAQAYRHVSDAAVQASTGINRYAPSGAINPAYTQKVVDDFEEAFRQAEQGNLEAIDRLLEAKRTMHEYEAWQEAQLSAEKDRLAALELKQIQEISAAEEKAFLKELNRLDILKQQRAAVREGLGFDTQRELSPLYQNIVGLGTAGVERSQEFMGRSPKQVLNDIITSFNKGERDVDLKTRSTAIGKTIADNTTKSIVSTFAENLKSGATSAASAATKFADAAAKAINKVFGIASPSQFIIELVKNLVGTYIAQMEKAHPRIRAATEKAFGQVGPERPVRRLTATTGGFELIDTSSRGYRPLPSRAFEASGSGGEMDETFRRFRDQIASLTTQPDIYRGLLNALPSSQLTTDLVGAANRRALAAEIPSFMPTQRMFGPGELERVIANAAADYFRTVRVPDPWVGLVGDYRKNFVDKIIGSTQKITAQLALPAARPVAGALPPALFASGLSPKQELRRLEAIRRSDERNDAVMAEDILRGLQRLTGPPRLSSSLFESGLSPKQELRRLEAIRRSDERNDAVMAEDELQRLQRLTGPPRLSSSLFESGLSPKQELRLLEARRRSDERNDAVMAEDILRGRQRLTGPPLLPPAGPPPPPTRPAAPRGDAAGPQLPSDLPIEAFGDVSKSSIRSIQNLNNVLREYQANLSPVNKEYKQLNALVEKQIRLNERELDARQRSSRRRLSGMQLAQGVGAVVSGGIFGGPEGFLGGAAGLALGGVGGAFAGAAFGAQVGMLRKALGTTAEYAAQIQKSKIALEGAAGNQQEYNRALQAADSVTRSLNVPQEIAVQGMTKLTAAVKGAGGQVSDAELVFKNVTAAIKATGGSAQDVDGAITAMVQVFSKGKVSAEELSGQLGERLPGAVTKFAEANNMTLPELQKGLEQGQIGLNELMNFIVKLGGDYSDVAEKIAASSQDAGARLTVAFNDMRLSVGAAIQPLGAELQTAFADFITDITPAVVAGVKAISAAFEFFSDNKVASDMAGYALKLGSIALAVLGVKKAFAGLTALNVYKWFVQITTGTKLTNAALLTTTGRVNTLKAALAGLLRFGLITIGIEIVVSGLGKLAEVQARMNKIAASGTEAFGQSVGGAALSKAEIQKLLKENKEERARREQELKDVIFPALTAQDEIAKAAILQLDTRRVKLEGMLERAVYATPADRARADLARLTEFESPTLDTTGAGATGRTQDDAAKAEQQVQERLRALRREIELNEQLSVLKNLQFEAEMAGDDELQIRLRGEERIVQITQKLASTLDGVTDDRLRTLEVTKAENQIAEARQQTAFEMARLEAQRTKTFEDIIADLDYELKLKYATTEEAREQLRIEREIAKLKAQGITDPEQIDAIISRQTRLAAPLSDLQIIEDAAKASKDELDKLTSSGYIAVTAANAIGDSFGNAFKGLITGSMTAQEALGNMFQSIADSFVDMVAQMIAEWIRMQILGIVKSFFSAAGGSIAGAASPEVGAIGSGAPIYVAANGGVFTSNGIQAFARGGVVNKPTLFPFADGGAMRTGLMGEAGPEAIMPLRRGPGGRLGVEAVGAFAANRQAMAGMPSGASSGAFEANRSVLSTTDGIARERAAERAMTATLDAPPQLLNIKYESQVINNVEYVSAEQFQRGMSDAAERGRALTISALKNSVKARRQVGM